MIKAIAYSGYGDADVLHPIELALPAPGPGQVRIAVRAVGVNPLDHRMRSGALAALFPVEFPKVPGGEAAGVVVAVGPGVSELRVGDEVFGRTASGSYAEEALADVARLTVKPATLSWAQAAALSSAAETGYRILDLLGVQAGETLLIHGGAGSVGALTTQLARARGIRVIGTASVANHERLRELGAEPVEYGPGLVDRVRALGGTVDAAVDAAGRGDALTASIELTGGRDRVLGIADPMGTRALGVRFSAGGEAHRTGEGVAAALALHEAGTLRLPIHASYPLADAARAHRDSERGHLSGKVVLVL
ncbi:NADP-dependent oxidoreductase [Embleya sp. AB8]|uniref:NADP-dependent oxidoreductase n=1 Tax=Embleya sp. AB8 TaxID=3156304 RepID=UPI003C7923CB